MTSDEIIKMAREAAARHGHALKDQPSPETVEFIVELVAMAAAAEREACAQVCEARYMGDNNREDMEARRCSAAIRARGQQ